ncbi:hypothetical protein QX776_12090 [Alteromonadaceae bacterium BrNp21-10]|nr:hypothetical protein [Alteromonadaceae bacterium BrNp21-10]
MSDKFELAKSLVFQHKYKKALAILRKVNHKNSHSNIEALELESECLFNEKNYQLAIIKMEQALKLTANNVQKIKILSNLASANEKLNESQKAITCLKRILTIDGTFTTAQQRLSLIKVAYSQKDYETVEEYGRLLINISEHSLFALLMLANSANELDNKEKALYYLSLIDTEIRTEGGITNTGEQNIIHLLNGYDLVGAQEKKESLLTFLKPKFTQEPWFHEIQQRTYTQPLNKDFNQSNEKPSTAKPLNVSELVTGSTPKTVDIVKKLVIALEKMGALFHSDLRIVECNDEISVRSARHTSKLQQFMAIPLRCMPLVNDYRFSVNEDGLLEVEAKKHMLNPEARHIMTLLTDMFNTSNKLAIWQKSYPLFNLAGFEIIVNKLLQAKTRRKLYAKYYYSEIESIPHDAIISTFFDSRTFTFDSPILRKIGVKTKTIKEKGFIPIIELANHKMGASGFQINNQHNSLEMQAKADEDNSEIFIQYNLIDPLSSFLTYGFVDQSATWVYSIPAVLKTMSGLTIEIQNETTAIDKNEVPKHLTRLVNFLPAAVIRNNTVVYISKLVLKNQHNFRQILTFVLNKIDIEGIYGNPINLEKEIRFLEKQILILNEKYWLTLKRLVQTQEKSSPKLPKIVENQLLELCEFYLSHIKRYITQDEKC